MSQEGVGLLERPKTATLGTFGQRDRVSIPVDDKTTVDSFIRAGGMPRAASQEALVNGRVSMPETPVLQGDEVTIAERVRGG